MTTCSDVNHGELDLCTSSNVAFPKCPNCSELMKYVGVSYSTSEVSPLCDWWCRKCGTLKSGDYVFTPSITNWAKRNADKIKGLAMVLSNLKQSVSEPTLTGGLQDESKRS